MKKYGECIANGLGSGCQIGHLYWVIIDQVKQTYKVNNDNTEYVLDDLLKYFKMILNKNELISLMKTNLGIIDEDIIEFRNAGEDTVCMKYKHDLIYITLNSNLDNIFLFATIEITSNNLARQKTFTIELYEDDINKFCYLLKLMHK